MFDSQILQALVLGIVQGLTEFLPISSSGHLILIPAVFGWEGVVDSLSFSVALHFGTTIAVLGFFWKDWARLVAAFFRQLPKGSKAVFSDFDSRFFLLLVVGTIPAGVVGLIFEDYFEEAVRSPVLVASMLIIFALLLFVADKVGKKTRDFKSITWQDGVVVGVAQALALIPGVSRSGVTITAGLFRNLDRETATRFSFLLSTPIIVAAAILSFKDIESFSKNGDYVVFLVGFVAAAISGWIAIKVLLNFVKSNNFNIFVIYRILLGIGILLFFLN